MAFNKNQSDKGRNKDWIMKWWREIQKDEKIGVQKKIEKNKYLEQEF